ncbi:MAG: 50S ribosomal protein L16 [Puniceicoccales bacterium]|jgi:large subunit ribosomal protein L16|nr:50S ribosomal protein L16 [Puniceicoccales bacterium]
MSKLSPARTKYRKVQKGRNRGVAKGGDSLAFGDFGIQALERCSMTASQIEAARISISRHLKRKGKLWVRVFPHKPITKKPAETRMGKGKGAVEYWASAVKPGVILFELAGVSLTLAREAFRLADCKLPIHCRFISRESLEEYK